MPFVPDKPARFVPDTPKEVSAWDQYKQASAGAADVNPGIGVGEAALQLGTGAIAAPVAGLLGLAAGAGNVTGLYNKPAAEVVRDTQTALTYQPRSRAGQSIGGVVAYPFEKLAQGADYVGGKTAELTGSPAVGAGVNAGIQFAPALLLKGKSKPAANPAAAAEAYVRSSVPGVDWAALPDSVRTNLTEIARSSGDFSKVSPEALARQARLAELNIPATRGQITRDPVQLRNEANASATNAGKPIRDVYVEQNKAILDNLNSILGQTGAKVTTAEGVGEATQAAARAKLAYQEKKVRRLYERADKAGETAQSVDVTPIIDLMDNAVEPGRFSGYRGWLKRKDADVPGAGLPIRDLERLRQDAVADLTSADGKTRTYARQLIDTIDQVTEGAGGRMYQEARKARREQGTEFEQQRGVARLVDDATRTDPVVALEDTWRRTVIGGSNADLLKVRKTLTEGGTPKTRKLGQEAWKEMQGATMRHIIDRATRSATKFEDGSPNLTPAALKQAIDSVGKAKIDIQFGPGVYEQLQKILDATVDVKTQPPSMIHGSPTVANFLAVAERWLTKVPGGRVAVGAVESVRGLNQQGAAVQAAREAVVDPVTAAAEASRNAFYNRRAKKSAGTAAALSQSAQERK